MAGSERFRVFLSAVSSELGAARSLVASDLRARGLEVKVQEDFRQEADSDTTLAKLHDYIKGCSAVVAIVGSRSGSVPPPAAAEPFAEMLPEGFDRASYTQWEVLFARHHRRRLSLYRSTDEYEPDQPAGEGDDSDRQAWFVEWLFGELGLDRGEFDTADGLRVMVLREDWPRLRTVKPVVLPYPSLGGLFRGRESFLDRVRASLTGVSDATAIAGRVVHGLGGVGKTRLAVEYAWRHLDDYTAALFVTGETPALLSQGLAGLCGVEALDLPERDLADEEVQVAAVLRWLVDHPGWLLIVDNLDTPQAAAAVGELMPRLRGGHLLMTGRLGEWGADVESLELDVLVEADAARFLLDRTDQRRRHLDSDEADAVELADELGGLALALEQAGAYVSQRRLSLAQYLADWRSQETFVREWHDERLMNYPRSVAVTWQTTIEQLTVPERVLLRLLAWMAPEPVPLFVLQSERAEAIFRAACELLEPAGDPEPSLLDPLAGLAGFSMASWDADAETVTVHRVVQSIMRDRIGGDGAAWVTKALELLDAAHPGNPHEVGTWHFWSLLRPHVAVSVEHADEASIADPTSELMNELGQFLRAKALLKEAEPLMRQALAIDETRLGPSHPDVATDLNNLAQLLKATDRLGEAEPMMRRALKIDETWFGPDHPAVAIDSSNLGQLLQASDRLAGAETLLRRALKIDETWFGPDDPAVAIDLNNLASLLKATNRLGEAEDAMRRALDIDEARRGPDHEIVAIRLGNLALLLQDTGRPGEAEPMFQRALGIYEAKYPPGHPNVAIGLANLASLFQATDRLGEAEPLMRRALAIDEANYGADHPRVAIDLTNLASLLQVANRLREAEPLMRLALEIFVKSRARTGHEHPHLRDAVARYQGLLRAMRRNTEEIAAALAELGLDPC